MSEPEPPEIRSATSAALQKVPTRGRHAAGRCRSDRRGDRCPARPRPSRRPCFRTARRRRRGRARRRCRRARRSRHRPAVPTSVSDAAVPTIVHAGNAAARETGNSARADFGSERNVPATTSGTATSHDASATTKAGVPQDFHDNGVARVNVPKLRGPSDSPPHRTEPPVSPKPTLPDPPAECKQRHGANPHAWIPEACWSTAPPPVRRHRRVAIATHLPFRAQPTRLNPHGRLNVQHCPPWRTAPTLAESTV